MIATERIEIRPHETLFHHHQPLPTYPAWGELVFVGPEHPTEPDDHETFGGYVTRFEGLIYRLEHYDSGTVYLGRHEDDSRGYRLIRRWQVTPENATALIDRIATRLSETLTELTL